jgi:diadenosine tetraphosphatase ApaH/serine/threonine PP2A family protein phosphatase
MIPATNGTETVRYGILGDIHSNLPALRAVVSRLEAERVDRILCVGDLVGYAAEPAECVAMVRDLDPVLIAGNHDWAAAGRLSLDFFNPAAAMAILWTRRRLGDADLEWLRSLPISRIVDDVTLVHSTVHDPEVFDYLQTPYDAYLSFQALTTRAAFVGHSHVPITFFDGTPILYSVDEELRFEDRRTISNVGSVGQPRDEDPRAAFGVFDSGERTLRVHRVEYDVEATIAKIEAAGLPPLLGERLRLGR